MVLSRFPQLVLLLLVARLLDSRLRFPVGSPKVPPTGSPSLSGTSTGFAAKVPGWFSQGSPNWCSFCYALSGTSAGFSAKVAKVLPRLSQVLLLLLVTRLLDSRLRFPRFSDDDDDDDENDDASFWFKYKRDVTMRMGQEFESKMRRRVLSLAITCLPSFLSEPHLRGNDVP